VPERKVQTESTNFSVMSMRLDAVAAGMFHLSRTEAAKQIAAGNVSLNYSQCLKTDCQIKDGDIISLKGHGKGTVSGTGGTSKKGRLFVYAEIYK
jgi:RNA-binding protein YlmH